MPRSHKYWKSVQKAYQDERLVLVLGAGVSTNYGVPNWKNLLRYLLIASIEEAEDLEQDPDLLAQLFTKLFGLSPLAAGRYLQSYYAGRNPDKHFAFEEALREALYLHLDHSVPNPLMQEIVNFCAAPGKSPNLDSVISYNYDDLLERSLSHLDISVPHKAIYDAGMNPDRGELAIYHVHGFLPQDAALTEKNRVAFGENIYHHQYNEIYSWRNIVQINKFRDYSCLFVGISLTDPNMRRLLDIARLQKGTPDDYHHIFRKRYNESEINTRLDVMLQAEPASAKLLDTISENGNIAASLIKIVERYEEKDAMSFGVRTIWVEDFDQIPEVLNTIRRG
ncbi:MAG: SIR2 family protein [Bacteroidia bacterium]